MYLMIQINDINKRISILASKYVDNKQMNGLIAKYECRGKVMSRQNKLTKQTKEINK